MKKFTFYFIRAGIYILIFLVPVCFINFTSERFVLPKITLMRILIPIIFLFWLVRVFVQDKKIMITPLTGIISIFIFWLFVTTIFSQNFFLSIFGVYGSYAWGFSTILMGFFVFLIISNEFERFDWIGASLAVIFSVSIVSIYGLLQILGFDPFHRLEYSYNRIFSTMGNPNFLGGFLLICVPIILFFYFKSEKFYLLFLLVFSSVFLNIGMTLSRASWLAFIIIFPIFFLLGGKEVFYDKKRVFLLILVTFILIAFVSQRKGIKFLSFDEEIPLLKERAKVLVSMREQSASYRIETWKSAIKMFFKNPFLGVGPDMFEYFFPNFMTPKFARFTDSKQVANSAHNTFLQVAATTGLIGFFLYIFLWFSVLKTALKNIFYYEERLFPTAIFCSLLGLFIFLQFHFFLPETVLYFWVMLGFVSSQEKLKKELIIFSRHTFKSLFLFISMVFVLFYSLFGIRHFLADFYYAKGNLSGLEKAVRLNPTEWLYRRTLVSFYLNISKITKDEKLKEKLFNKALKNALTNLKNFPRNVWTNHQLGLVYVWRWQCNKNDEDLKNAERFIRKSHMLGPLVKEPAINLMKIYLFKKEKMTAFEIYKELKNVFSEDEDVKEFERVFDVKGGVK